MRDCRLREVVAKGGSTVLHNDIGSKALLIIDHLLTFCRLYCSLCCVPWFYQRTRGPQPSRDARVLSAADQ